MEAGGWVKQAYGLSKVAVTKMTFILAEELKGDSRHIIINAVHLLDDWWDVYEYLLVLPRIRRH